MDDQEQEQPEKNTICFQLHIKMPGNRRKADLNEIDLKGADPEMMGLSKAIFDSDSFRAIDRHVRLMKVYLEARSIPSQMLRGGFYDLPIGLVEEVVAEIDKMTETFNELIEVFITDYGATAIDDARGRLGAQFNPSDYKSVDSMRAAFEVETRFIETSVPNQLRTVSRAIYEQAAAKSAAILEKQRETVVAVMRVQMKELTDAMVAQLGVREDGKKMAFRKRSVERLGEFLKYATDRNVMNDAELSALTRSANDLLSGLDVEAVKKDDGYRGAMRESFEVLQKRLAVLVDEEGIRDISFEPEEFETSSTEETDAMADEWAEKAGV